MPGGFTYESVQCQRRADVALNRFGDSGRGLFSYWMVNIHLGVTYSPIGWF